MIPAVSSYLTQGKEHLYVLLLWNYFIKLSDVGGFLSPLEKCYFSQDSQPVVQTLKEMDISTFQAPNSQDGGIHTATLKQDCKKSNMYM